MLEHLTGDEGEISRGRESGGPAGQSIYIGNWEDGTVPSRQWIHRCVPWVHGALSFS